MSDSVTVARPYAKAIFEYALAAGSLSEWSALLNDLARVVVSQDAIGFITNPATSLEQHEQLLFAIVPKAKTLSGLSNLIELLASNKRLLLLPEICIQFDELQARHDKTMKVGVKTFAPITPAQESKLIEKLTKRVSRQVTLDVEVDESLLGGAVIQAGDLVIDGSVRGQIAKLAGTLA